MVTDGVGSHVIAHFVTDVVTRHIAADISDMFEVLTRLGVTCRVASGSSGSLGSLLTTWRGRRRVVTRRLCGLTQLRIM